MKRLTAATLAVICALVLHGDAQPRAQIYVQYDGFVRNKDAHTLTLSFGYYNLNVVPVTIQPGEGNGFLPGPADRKQPILLRPGRHRFACTIIVPDTFAGSLQWQMKFAGGTSVTTAKSLNGLYELELNSERRAMAGIDPAKEPKNVCANHAPNVQVGGVFNANADVNVNDPGAELLPPPTNYATALDRDLNLPGLVNDDDLPRDARVSVSWRKVNGPGDVVFSSPATAATNAKFSAPGLYELELAASDTDKSGSAKIRVNVAGPGQPVIVTETAPDTYSNAMKNIQASSTALRLSVGSRNYDNAAQQIAQLKDAFVVAQLYWAGKGADDATRAAQVAMKAIADLEAANKARNDAAMLEAQVLLNGTCGNCHTAHRQRMPDGHFEIK
jgi:hypothetical protein